uniref:Multicopper oxidase n=1 Tax=Ganoderma boninense TaxID=34458 RepID=A0A5K1K6V1_9APHY|nr:Multicopper oxidase [Ganoderma boninense]
MADGETDLTLHTIHSPDDPQLADILALSNRIFSADSTTKHSSLSYWQNQLTHPVSRILYLAPASAPARPIGFIFVIPRIADPPLKSGATDSVHVWLAGVLPEWRKAGCLTRMIQELESIDQLTICTYPSRFPNMWRWLSSRDWTQERDFEDGKVLFSRVR